MNPMRLVANPEPEDMRPRQLAPAGFRWGDASGYRFFVAGGVGTVPRRALNNASRKSMPLETL